MDGGSGNDRRAGEFGEHVAVVGRAIQCQNDCSVYQGAAGQQEVSTPLPGGWLAQHRPDPPSVEGGYQGNDARNPWPCPASPRSSVWVTLPGASQDDQRERLPQQHAPGHAATAEELLGSSSVAPGRKANEEEQQPIAGKKGQGAPEDDRYSQHTMSIDMEGHFLVSGRKRHLSEGQGGEAQTDLLTRDQE